MDSVLVSILFVVLIAALVIWVISLVPLPHPWGRVAQAVVAVIVVIWLFRTILMPGVVVP